MPEIAYTYSTRPDQATLKAWFQGLEPKAQAFLMKHQMQVPFWYYGYPGKFAEACLANKDIQYHLEHSPAWQRDRRFKYPEMRFEFDMVVAIGGMEVFDWAKNKAWGGLNWIAPLLPDDPVDGMFLSCIHNPETSKWHKLREQRWWMRRKLGRGRHGWVSDAMRETKYNFVGGLTTGAQSMTIADTDMVGTHERIASAERKKLVRTRSDGVGIYKIWFKTEPDTRKARWILHALGMTPEQFWRACKGLDIIPSGRMQDPQCLLFDQEE